MYNLLVYINYVSHRIPFDAQCFIKRQCIERASAVETQIRYKLKYIVTTNNVRAESNVAVKDDGSFEHLWTRISSSENMPPSKEMAKFDIARPGETQHQKRYCFFRMCACLQTKITLTFRVDVRIVGLPQTQPETEESDVRKIAEEIIKTMSQWYSYVYIV